MLEDAELGGKSLPLAVEPEIYDALCNGLQAVLKPTLELGVVPVAILCSEDTKAKVLSVTRGAAKKLFVLTFGELDPAIRVEQIGSWGLASR